MRDGSGLGAFLLAALLGCDAAGAEAVKVRIYAASSLTDALDEAIGAYRLSHPSVRVLPNFGGSSDLARQILAGAPADLFFSADEAQMDRLAAAELLEAGTRVDVLSNQLVVVEHQSVASSSLKGPGDLERLEGRIAMADPEAVPAGVYARAYLATLGLWQSLRGRIVPTLDVRAALAAVASGNVAAGFVYRTDAAIEPRVRIAFAVPLESGPRIAYPLAIVRGRGTKQARSLHAFLLSPEAGAVFERHGFRLPEER